ncbi:hypothetical protein JYK14_20065 [Siccirubricoccus sp. KC 17139]|uniref:EF-hand domain-containing protein n=1 Tax=Siccirubricoccus soli TaxID=2899147 RepID=A0ABT1D950_9PROT|nr:hypothetical protein [Siccirubricoccus soli]MCO6418443.1 hypothetical protein [Siccirubricoccus soli]MCP2684578.1 hypothetical protein [Siccirubricoccus soli]
MQVSGGGGITPPSMQVWRSQLERNTFKSPGSGRNDGARPEAAEATKARLKELQEKAAEAAAAANSADATGAAFARLDRDGDGSLSEAELAAGLAAKRSQGREGPQHRQGAGMPGGLGGGLLAQLLHQTEEPASAAGGTLPALLRRTDRNCDGVITQAELRASAEGNGGQPPAPGGQGDAGGQGGLGNALMAQLFGQEAGRGLPPASGSGGAGVLAA